MHVGLESPVSIASRSRRFLLKAACGVALAAGTAFAGLAHAAYPDKPVQVIISFPPAGATDVLARAVTQRMSEVLGQTMVVDNRPGAGGAIGLTADIIQVLANALQKTLDDPKLKATLAEQGAELKFMPGAEFKALVEKEHQYWGDVVRAANVSAN